MKSLFEQLGGTYTRQGDLLTAGMLDGLPCRHRGADAETLSSAGRTIRRHRGRDAGNCIRVTNKRGAYGLRLFYMQKKNNAVLKRHCSKLY